jgi:polysaccharide pyruvyl transferase CsaB
VGSLSTGAPVSTRPLRSEKKASVVVAGWYGNGNLGDEMILRSMLIDLRSTFPKSSITVLTDNVEETRRLHGVAAIDRGKGGIDILKRLTALTSADLFILGGGNPLMDYGKTDRHVPHWLKWMELAQRLGVRTMAYGLGAGPIRSETGKQAIRRILHKADAVCVRDRMSLQLLRELGLVNVILTADPVLLLPEFYGIRRDANTPANKNLHIMVCLRHWHEDSNTVPDESAFAALKLSLAAALSRLRLEFKARITFVPMRIQDPSDDDRIIAREVLRLMGDEDGVTVLDCVPDDETFIRMTSQSELVIAMRLHPLVIAASLGVPVAGINYHQKVGEFLSSIGEGRRIISPYEASGRKLQDIFRDALASGLVAHDNIEEVNERKKLARINFEVAFELIQRRGTRKIMRWLRLIGMLVSYLGTKLRRRPVPTPASHRS